MNLKFKKDLSFEEDRNEFVKKDSETFERIMYIPTLPSIFNHLNEKIVKIETEEPQYVIELLGNLLGINDYKTNKAAFWFLDTIALQVLRFKDCLDNYYRSVLISWLAGEMKLIRDKKLLREDFFKEMRTLFIYVAKKLCSDDQLPHWELLMDAYSEIMSQNSTSETEYLITNKLSQKELITENNELTSQENKLFFIDLKNYDSGNSIINNLQKKSPTNSKIFLTTKNSQTNTSGNAKIKSSNLNPSDVLNIIVKATYSMYTNELRYFLIYEVFVKQIQLQIFHMPHTFRTARQIKLADSEKGLFHVKLRERLKKIASESIINDNDEQYNEEKTIDNTKEEKEEKMKDLDMEIPPTPQSSLMEDELLANNRRFILPLIEANEAAQIFEMHAGNI